MYNKRKLILALDSVTYVSNIPTEQHPIPIKIPTLQE